MDYEKRKKAKTKIYKEIYKMVQQKIKIAKKTGSYECYYILPEYISGFPVYDQTECMVFLIQRLRLNNYKCRYVFPMTIYTLWEKI